MLASVLWLIVATTAAESSGAPIYGRAEIVDGDSLTLNGTPIRLFGIDAPEHDQFCSRDGLDWACGTEAANRLKALVAGKQVRCLPNGKDQYGRVLARCSSSGTDINRAMVAGGYAVAFRKYSSDYVAAEAEAKQARRGLWAGTFDEPSVYRAKQQRQMSRPAASRPKPSARASSGCVIKGNHSRRGEWIYHLPGMPYYEQTRPEAMFCSEAEAQVAGYRRARVR